MPTSADSPASGHTATSHRGRAHDGLVIHGRSDATLNAGGVRIGTAEIYRQVERLPEVAEALAVGQEWDDDTRIVLFVRLAEGAELDDGLVSDHQAIASRELLAAACPGQDHRCG